MVDISRRELMYGGLFTVFGAGSYLLRPARAFARLSDGALNRAIPERIGTYSYESGGDFILPPEDDLSKKLYDKVVMRTYVAPGMSPILALFAYGSTQNLTLQLHRPDQCYPMLGFSTTPITSVPMEMYGTPIPANLLTATRPGRVEQVLFWSRIGNDFPATRFEETVLVAKQNLLGRMPDGILVRLSIIGLDRAAAQRQILKFVTMLDGALPPLGRRILMGSKHA